MKLQISRRETPPLATEVLPQIEQSYFRYLPFVLANIRCLALPEVLAEKMPACYQRNKARDIYDLGMFAARPLNQDLVRRLVVLKLWQSRDSFVPECLFRKFEDGLEFHWDDLRQLLRRTIEIDKDRITAQCIQGFRFLDDLIPEEETLANDAYQREHALWNKLKNELPS